MSARAQTALPWLGTVLRLILAGVLGVAGALKVADASAAVAAVRAYQLLPEATERIVGYGLPFLEIALALLLLLGLGTRLAALGAGLLMIIFIAGISSAWARGLSIDCGCFGGGGNVAPGTASYLPELLRDAGLLLAAAFLVWRPRTALSFDATLDTGSDVIPDVDDDSDTDTDTEAELIADAAEHPEEASR